MCLILISFLSPRNVLSSLLRLDGFLFLPFLTKETEWSPPSKICKIQSLIRRTLCPKLLADCCGNLDFFFKKKKKKNCGTDIFFILCFSLFLQFWTDPSHRWDHSWTTISQRVLNEKNGIRKRFSEERDIEDNRASSVLSSSNKSGSDLIPMQQLPANVISTFEHRAAKMVIQGTNFEMHIQSHQYHQQMQQQQSMSIMQHQSHASPSSGNSAGSAGSLPIVFNFTNVG